MAERNGRHPWLCSDLILVLEDGEIIERGRHEDLLRPGGRYANLYRTQFTKHLAG